jgi:hypothetical protein
MAELTKEQVEQAREVYIKSGPNFDEYVRAMAPYLQLPWDEPTESEISDAQADIRFTSEHQAAKVLFEFVRHRNAALLPKAANEAIKDLLWLPPSEGEDHEHNNAVIEAYQRGKKGL